MWDERYSAEEYVYGTEPNTFLASEFNIIPKGKVLCLADGEGRNSVFLAKQGYDVTAVDLSLVGLSKAKKLAQASGVSVEYIHADLADFDFGTDHWDGVVSIFCHLPAPVRALVHEGVKNGLKANGVLLVEAYTPKQLQYKTGGPQQEAMLYSCALIAKDFSGLEFLRLEEIERNVEEGVFHSGLSAVVQAVARKR